MKKRKDKKLFIKDIIFFSLIMQNSTWHIMQNEFYHAALWLAITINYDKYTIFYILHPIAGHLFKNSIHGRVFAQVIHN
ncbi:MAG: hypothetical protein FWE72_06775 [Spirochaetaceae bacterium]|nr:hypothetical protein [Spirochaetaceae bacterium]